MEVNVTITHVNQVGFLQAFGHRFTLNVYPFGIDSPTHESVFVEKTGSRTFDQSRKDLISSFARDEILRVMSLNGVTSSEKLAELLPQNRDVLKRILEEAIVKEKTWAS